jgi:hypothetical protein
MQNARRRAPYGAAFLRGRFRAGLMISRSASTTRRIGCSFPPRKDSFEISGAIHEVIDITRGRR